MERITFEIPTQMLAVRLTGDEWYSLREDIQDKMWLASLRSKMRVTPGGEVYSDETAEVFLSSGEYELLTMVPAGQK